MYVKLLKNTVLSSLVIITALLNNACGLNNAGTYIEFLFSTGIPSNSIGEKYLYINDDMEKLELNAELKIISGEAEIKIFNLQDNEIAWSAKYSEDSVFTIELRNMKKDCEYVIKIETVQSIKTELIISSETGLVKDIEKPERYVIKNE